MIDVLNVAIAGAVDRVWGRPRTLNPYSQVGARSYWEAWLLGWDQADFMLESRGRREATRWLREAA